MMRVSAHAVPALVDLAQSGESEQAFARRKGISRQRLRYWRGLLGRRTAKPVFVAVDFPAARPVGDEITIRVGEIAICVREDLDVDHLARIVEVLSRRTRGC